MRLLPHELDEPGDTPETIASAQKFLRTRIANAILQSTDNRLTPAQQASAIEAELRAQGFDATVKEKP